MLAKPFEVTGERQPLDTSVRIDMQTGNVSLSADEPRRKKFLAERRRRLDRDETVDGVLFPAGSEISDSEIALPHPTHVLSALLAGTLLRSSYVGAWTGTLVENTTIAGWPCRAGEVAFSEYELRECVLSFAHDIFGISLPPGTLVSRYTGGREPWKFRLPENTGTLIPALQTTAPPGATLYVIGAYLTDKGEFDRMTSAQKATVMVRGVPLSSQSLYLRGDNVLSSLSEPFTVAGEVRPAGTAVRVSLQTDTVSLGTE
jgi:hypothetical protein